jgi:NADPH-dependent 2,4-dienoyl-CoA reductase/sulfur reductase-like enzyme
MHLVIVGGSDAGISAGLRAKELEPDVRVTLVVADAFANFSVCGLPFYLSGEVPDWRMLAHRTLPELEAAGLEFLFDTTAERVDAVGKRLHVRARDGSATEMAYDRLLIATGATPLMRHIRGLALPGVFPLHTMADSFGVDEHLRAQPRSSAVVIGAGYIGLEMADALTLRGLEVTVVERAPSVLRSLDPEFGRLVQSELERHGVRVHTNAEVEALEAQSGRLLVTGRPELTIHADLVIVALGVRPATELAQTAGVELGSAGAIRVDAQMQTTVPDILAAGDCVETWHRVLGTSSYIPLGTTAHKQGRVAGETAVGRSTTFAGTLGTQVVKVFDLVAARTGLRDADALAAGFSPHTSAFTFWDHKQYYPDARQLHVRVTGDRRTGRLLGAQMVGSKHSEVGKRIDIFASALFHGSRIDELEQLDLSYTPPFSSPWDPVQMGAQGWLRDVATGQIS